ncbi:MAG: SagB family peptide dehydrogenase, partial [Butyrivibrio sp.]|nr:SagB family peptide dehydrogenase [Butyrivibrio sp.]
MENRQSHRSFKETEAVPFENFSQVISSFRQRKQSNGDIRYYYPCAGGLYPIDIYIYVKDGRVDKLDGGLYYYSPVRDTIELINKEAKIDENSQFYTNKKIFSSSAFTVYFVYNAAVTMPKYSGAGIMYACIDTGIMAEQLVNISEMLGIGTCSIGNIDFEKISHLFNLNKNQVLLHSVECGLKLDGNMCLEPLTLIDQENVNEVQDNDYKNSSLRVVLLSGDWIPVNLSDKIKKIFTEADVISLGGATEASIWSIIYPINHTDPNWKSIPYGRPMYNQQYYVLDYELNDCHIGILGDLYIGGAGLADCYYQNEEASKAFIEHEKYGRLYKTGDCGIMQDDGNIIFMGRKDFQLKINGFRIEAEEIENCLMTHDSVQRAIIVDNINKFGKKYLCAYVVLIQGQKFNKEELKAHLLNKLPSYMVPSYFVELKEIPLTPNGKVDKKSLPNPQEDENELEVVLPRNNVETQIYDIWKEVLGKTNIGVKDNFFDVGGESLLVMKVHEKIDALYPNVL